MSYRPCSCAVINVLSSSVVDHGLLLWISLSIFYLQKVANGTISLTFAVAPLNAHSERKAATRLSRSRETRV
jgi:hypothetical protein